VTDVTELPKLDKPPGEDGDDMDVAGSLPPMEDPISDHDLDEADGEDDNAES
jgi:hypothetical protein